MSSKVRCCGAHIGQKRKQPNISHGIVSQTAETGGIVGSSPTYSTSRLANVVKLGEWTEARKHNSIDIKVRFLNTMGCMYELCKHRFPQPGIDRTPSCAENAE